jgi:hypothetical protein
MIIIHWTLKQAEMKVMTRIAGYILLDRRINEDILEEIKADSVERY